MTRATRLAADPRSPRLFRLASEDRPSLWTAAVGEPPTQRGEPVRRAGEYLLRRWEASRSKLAAGLLRGYSGPIPRPSEHWLYLGAATGTTASYVADLVGPKGVVVAVEPSPRSFVRLLALARRYPNVWPVLGDARRPDDYAGLVPPADGLYADIAQPDQVEILLTNAERFLRSGGGVILALKTASMGREPAPADHLERSLHLLEPRFHVDSHVRLDPVHRRHFLVGAHERRAASDDRGSGRSPASWPRAASRAARPQ